MSITHTFQCECESHTLIVSVMRNVSSIADQELKQELDEIQARARDNDVRAVLFDFADVEYFGSTMLEALLRVWKTAQASGCQMSLCNVSRVGREVLHVAKFDTIWKIFSNRQAALQALAA